MVEHRHGMADGGYEKMLAEQNGLCPGCGKTEAQNDERKFRRFAVDHDHKTGQIRGLLCDACNRGLGLLGDSRETLQRLLDYLKKADTDHDQANGKKRR